MKKDMEIYESRKVNLGGFSQTILLEGKRKNMPVMIMLHGGPWGPVIYGEAYRGYYPRLSENFILVWWDQYGCGKNYTKDLKKDLTVQTFADMTVDLVDEMKRIFPQNKLILNGNSFGSYLSMYAAFKRQDTVDGVINLGPIMNMKEAVQNFENVCIKHATPGEKKKLEQSKKGEAIKYLLMVNKIAEKHTNCAHYKGREGHDSLTMKWMCRLFTSSDYKFSDVLDVLKAQATCGKSQFSMWNSLTEIDITEITGNIKLPVIYIQGEEELYILPERLEKLTACHENMEYRRIPYCGHIPTKEAWPVMLDAMIAFKDRI